MYVWVEDRNGEAAQLLSNLAVAFVVVFGLLRRLPMTDIRLPRCSFSYFHFLSR